MPEGRLQGRVAVITGASRGIGRAMALGLAREGARVAVAAKSVRWRRDLPGDIRSVAGEIEALGAEALPIQVDVRKEEDLSRLVNQVEDRWGRLDVLVHNAGALWWMPVADTPAKRFDLVMDVNVRAGFLLTQLALPLMLRDGGAHVVMCSPPVDLSAVPGRVAYLISKYGMTLLAQGLAQETAGQALSANALWPVTAIESQATVNFKLGDPSSWRKADIMADALVELAVTPPGEVTGEALLDEPFLRSRGWTDFTKYRVDPEVEPPALTWERLAAVGRRTDQD